jgi:hypothetical protein
MAGSNSKKKRTPKTSKGIHGAKRHPLSALQRVLLGKGQYQSFKPLGSRNAGE